ncbi:MAG: hypothetical protein KA604_00720 [Candidatus Saccharimonas sp.]|nr:hypothetical protein [Candidatus Saccharimonas sp.]
MSQFVHTLEVREISPRFTVVKGLRLTHRVIHALIERFSNRGVRFSWRSNCRLEIELTGWAQWHDVRDEIIPMIVDGSILTRCPGHEGHDVIVTYMAPTARRYEYRETRREVYPQYTHTAAWMLHQQILFGPNWALEDETSLH